MHPMKVSIIQILADNDYYFEEKYYIEAKNFYFSHLTVCCF